MNLSELNDSVFELYAAKYYDNPAIKTREEFDEDLMRIKYIRIGFTKYYNNDSINERLLLNHFIAIYNVFEPRACTNMLIFKIPEKLLPYLKTYLLYLNYWPEDENEIPVDSVLADKLRKI